MNVRVFDISIPRSLNPGAISSAYKKIKKLVSTEHYNLIHCHSPIGGVICRQAAKNERKRDTKVIYTAHGFHFYDGAPLKNWLIYYPIEKHFSRYTDVLITINKEDYKRASEKFYAKKTVYVPGIGVDIDKFAPRESGREKIRTELGVTDDQILLLSVGESNDNMNLKSVIKAIGGEQKIVYVIVGVGEEIDELGRLAQEIGVDVRLVGFRNDVADFYDAADVFVLPSIRDGINVNFMEAMASGCALACGRIKDNTDLITDKECHFEPANIDEVKSAIIYAVEHRYELARKNLEKIKSFDLSTVQDLNSEISCYEQLKILMERQRKRIEIGVPVDAKLLISVGELSVRKNHKVVVEALQALPEDYWYVIVGKGDLNTELTNLDHTGRLKLLGFRTDIVDLLHCADLFVFPSLQEGLPVALMEAMAAGLPCVASRIRGNMDLIVNEECLFNPVKCMKLERLLVDVTSRCFSNELGLEYSMKSICEKMLNIFDEKL